MITKKSRALPNQSKFLSTGASGRGRALDQLGEVAVLLFRVEVEVALGARWAPEQPGVVAHAHEVLDAVEGVCEVAVRFGALQKLRRR